MAADVYITRPELLEQSLNKEAEEGRICILWMKLVICIEIPRKSMEQEQGPAKVKFILVLSLEYSILT